jgi:hypothetical protein
MRYKFIETYNLKEVFIYTGLRFQVEFQGKEVVSLFHPKFKINIASSVKTNIELITGKHVMSRVIDPLTKEESFLIHKASQYTRCKSFIGSRGSDMLLEMLKPEPKTFTEWLKAGTQSIGEH